MGEANHEIDVNYEADPLEIGFNAKYLLDCLPVIESEKIELCLKYLSAISKKSSACFFRL